MIVSDDAGQFRVANHALCWIHAERLLQKLMPATPKTCHKLDISFYMYLGDRLGLDAAGSRIPPLADLVITAP
ncbi:hypothetical protein GGE07_006093 [Sinorhizobium terangae]|uniref:hypothetical protein n=1 Tax=Sinorhizobium terangae TaxID=110322 RepID=UPI001791F9F8|nr:hypothetical protein [Sinorhizobium terangae]MBB4189411.1 hypothetical protein [Sinorhizobium terangae]